MTEKDNIIASALKVRRINVDSVTLSIAFSSTNFARCILFNKDVAGNVITTTNKVFSPQMFFPTLMLLVCTHHNRLQLEHLVELNLTSPSLV